MYNFNYAAHYKTDAEKTDYFMERDGATAHDEKRLREYIVSFVPKTNLILDVGCGNGWVASTFLKKNIKIISLDISITNPKKVLLKFGKDNHTGIVSDAIKLPFKNSTLPVIIASEIIEHTLNPENFINELMRVLKPGGKLIISTPYKEKIKYFLCIHCNQLTPLHSHLHSFDEDKLKYLYQKKDLKKFSYKIFGNKALLFLRTYVILKFLPFTLWKLIDKIANLIINKPAHIVAVYEKSELN